MKLQFPFLILLFFFITEVSRSQTCGIQAVIEVKSVSGPVNYTADTTGFLAGWSAYSYEWYVNGILDGTQDVYSGILPSGYNHVCLKVYGTNTVTGDSCIAEHCNIFQSTGDAFYNYFDVSIAGLNVTFNGGTTATASGVTFDAYYDFGDGNQSLPGPSGSGFHTYNAPGNYTVYFYTSYNDPVYGVASGLVSRKIAVGTGSQNLTINQITENTLCDSVSLNVTTSVPFTSGGVGVNSSQTGVVLNSGGPTSLVFDVPGHDILQVGAYESAGLNDVKNKIVLINDCNVIPDTIAGTVYEDLNFNGIKDPSEPVFQNSFIKVQGDLLSDQHASHTAEYYVQTDSAGSYKILVPHAEVKVVLTLPSGYGMVNPQQNFYTVNFNSGTLHTGFDFGITQYSATLCGTTYLDDNNDGIFNVPDRALTGVNVKAHHVNSGFDFHAYTNAMGGYCFMVPPGNYIIQPVYFYLDSASYTPDSIITFAFAGATFNNNNFGFTSPVPANFGITLQSFDPPRPGFDFSMGATITNSGYLSAQGTVTIDYDPALTVLSVDPVSGVINTGNHTITWTSDTIHPGYSAHYYGSFNVPASTPLGTQLVNTASVTALPAFPENDLSNNNTVLNLTVTGSYDPNDKNVLPLGVGATGDVLPDTRFRYLIRFQNTGTAAAVNVIVTDTIDQNLNINTLMVDNASHAYTVSVEDRVISWRFLGINLPDSNTNEPLSHGYIEYSISPMSGLTDGTTITNSANIYFDFNAPVITNTTLNTIQSVISGFEIPGSYGVTIFPNPARDIVNISAEKDIDDFSLLLYDMKGQLLRTIYYGSYSTGSVETIDLNELSSGIYLIKFTSDEKQLYYKLIKY